MKNQDAGFADGVDLPIFRGDREKWSDIAPWRRSTREALIQRRRSIAPAERQARSGKIAAGLDKVLTDVRDRIVGLYWPIKAEPNLTHWAERIDAEGARIALPVVIKMGQPLEFRIWRPGEPLVRGHWNIPVPANGPAVWPDVVVAPLVGFDQAGFRLGYGGGFYDRTIAAAPSKPWLIGVGFVECKLPTIHPQPHDIAMNLIVTDA